MALSKSKTKKDLGSHISTSGTSKQNLCEYVKARSLSKDDLENERIYSDLERNKTRLKTKIDNNREAIINIKEQNVNLLREREVNEVLIIENEAAIEELENGIEKLKDFGVRFYGMNE